MTFGRSRRIHRMGIVALAAFLLCAAAAWPQEGFGAGAAGDAGWVRIEAGPLILEGPASYRSLLEDLAGRARVFLPDLERSLGTAPAGPITMVVIPPDPSPYPAVARLDRAAPKWAAGFALASWRVGGLRIAQADTYPFGDPASVLAHEVAHFLIHDAAGGASGRVPRWFNEGASTREQRRWSLRDAFVYSSNLVVGPLPSLRQMDRAFAGSSQEARLAYAASFDFVDWASDEYGEDLVRRVLRRIRAHPDLPFEQAWAEVAGVPLSESEASWRRTSLALFRWIPVVTGAGGLWGAITLLFLFVAWGRRRRTRKIYEKWEEEEQDHRARRTQRDGRGRWIH